MSRKPKESLRRIKDGDRLLSEEETQSVLLIERTLHYQQAREAFQQLVPLNAVNEPSSVTWENIMASRTQKLADAIAGKPIGGKTPHQAS